MKNKILALMMAVNAILLMMGMPQSQAALDTDSILHRMRAVELVRDHSTVLWDAEEAARVSKKDYDKQVLRSNTIDIQKMFVFHNPFTDEDVYHYFSLSEQMQMRMLKEFIPEQMKYVWEMKLKAVSATENALANTADSLFSGLYASYQNRLLAEKSLEIARKAYEREKARYDNGQITKLDLEGAYLNIETAENAISKAERDFDNIHRQSSSP